MPLPVFFVVDENEARRDVGSGGPMWRWSSPTRCSTMRSRSWRQDTGCRRGLRCRRGSDHDPAGARVPQRDGRW